jgi:hypothetical protein
VIANTTNFERTVAAARGVISLIRPAEQYRKIADSYDSMALAMFDEALRWTYLDFAQQWRDVAQRADIDLGPSKLRGRWRSANIL